MTPEEKEEVDNYLHYIISFNPRPRYKIQLAISKLMEEFDAEKYV